MSEEDEYLLYKQRNAKALENLIKQADEMNMYSKELRDAKFTLDKFNQNYKSKVDLSKYNSNEKNLMIKQ